MAPVNRGGKGKCSVCASEHQDQVNKELATQVPLRTIGKRWGLDKQALSNHRRNHLSPALLALHRASGAAPVLEDLREEKAAADAMYEAARAVMNMPLALQANAQRHEISKTIAKVTGELDERPQITVNIQQTTEWLQLREVVLAFIPQADHMRFAKQLRLLEGGKS